MTTPAPAVPGNPTGPPAVGPRGLAIRAAREGKAAALAGEPVQVCPYAASRPFTRRAWLLGYTAGRQEAGVDLDVDPDPQPGEELAP